MKTLFQADESFCTYLESGMPIGLRSQIEDGYLGDWYKSCYHTLHKNFGRDYKSNYDDFYNSFFLLLTQDAPEANNESDKCE